MLAVDVQCATVVPRFMSIKSDKSLKSDLNGEKTYQVLLIISVINSCRDERRSFFSFSPQHTQFSLSSSSGSCRPRSSCKLCSQADYVAIVLRFWKDVRFPSSRELMTSNFCFSVINGLFSIFQWPFLDKERRLEVVGAG